MPNNSRWIKNAFVVERNGGKGVPVAVLILDDHYRSDDPAYSSQTRAIGTDISSDLLCSLPTQATWKEVSVDPIVTGMIKARCGKGG